MKMIHMSCVYDDEDKKRRENFSLFAAERVLKHLFTSIYKYFSSSSTYTLYG